MLRTSHRSLANSSSSKANGASAPVPSMSLVRGRAMFFLLLSLEIETNLILGLFPRSSQCLLIGMHVILIGLLNRGLASSLLKQLSRPSKLGKLREHGMAKNMGSHVRYTRFLSYPPKKRILLRIRKRLGSA